MKKFVTILGLVTATLLTTQGAYANRSVGQILAHYYPSYNTEYDCRVHKRVRTYDGGEKENVSYCIDYSTQKTVQTPNGERLYLLVSGPNMNSSAGWADALVGMFVLKPQGGGWAVEIAKPFISVGVNGNSVQDWSLHEFAPNTYGFLATHGYGMNGGTSLADFVILTPKGNTIIDSHIPSFLNTEATMFCGNKCDDIKASIKINRQTTVNGFYPLDLTLNGRLNKKLYKNQKYRITYTNKGYVAPKSYPLNNSGF